MKNLLAENLLNPPSLIPQLATVNDFVFSWVNPRRAPVGRFGRGFEAPMKVLLNRRGGGASISCWEKGRCLVGWVLDRFYWGLGGPNPEKPRFLMVFDDFERGVFDEDPRERPRARHGKDFWAARNLLSTQGEPMWEAQEDLAELGRTFLVRRHLGHPTGSSH